jgi:hypothetical protein
MTVVLMVGNRIVCASLFYFCNNFHFVIARQTMEDNRSYSINKLPLIQSTSCDKSRKRSKRTESSRSDLIDRSFRRRRILWISYIRLGEPLRPECWKTHWQAREAVAS